MTLATSVSPRCIWINFTSMVDQRFRISPQVGIKQFWETQNLKQTKQPEIWCQMSWHFGYPKDSMHSASSRKHQAWTEWIFCFFWLVEDVWGKKLEISMFDFCYFHHSLFLSNICRVRWFDRSLQSMFSAPKKLVSCLKPMVCGNRDKHVFGVLTYQGPFRDGLSPRWLTTFH